MGPISKSLSLITLGLKGLPGTNPLAYGAHLEVVKKKKCCEYDPRNHNYDNLFSS
jgi:hypothetical protein